MTDEEINLAVAKGLGLDARILLVGGKPSGGITILMDGGERLILDDPSRLWAQSADAGFRDLVPNANARGWFLRTSQLPNGEHRAAFEKSDGTDMRGFSCESLSRSIAYAFVETLHA